jgi:RHS repeat-associated protein
MFRDTDGNGSLDATYYYLQDDLYNVVALADATGAVVERYTYDDYGAPTVWVEDGQNPGTWIENTTATGAPVSNVGNPFMFTGRRWDEVLALYDYRTRYYNPYLGRFLRIDTIGLWRDANNLGNPYAYVGNNPWSRLDPYGEGWWGDFWGWMGLQGGGDAINNRPAMAPPPPGSAPRRTMDDPSANIFLTGDPLAITSQQRFSAAASQTRETTIEMGQHVVAQNVVYLEGVAIAASAGPVIKAAEKTGIFGWIGRGVRRATSFWRKSSDDVVEVAAARSAASRASAAQFSRITTPWHRNVYQRGDVNWDFVRPAGVPLSGQTNRAAARLGYTPVRINPNTGRVDDLVLHHALDDARGAVIETWRSSHTKFHNTIGRQTNAWRLENPSWADAWQREQSAYWRWRTGVYNPPSQPSLRLPGDGR